MRMHDARVGGHRRGSPQLERRPSSLGLDHACRCIANCKPPCAPPFALGVELRGPPRGGMRIPRFLQGAREGCLKSSRPARYHAGPSRRPVLSMSASSTSFVESFFAASVG
jgi:hypothetical protein